MDELLKAYMQPAVTAVTERIESDLLRHQEIGRAMFQETEVRFNGPEYVPARDNGRLTSQLNRIHELMADHGWRTLAQIGEATGDPTPSISAQLRHLRKERFGSHVIDRRHIGNGLYEYRLVQ